MNEQTKDDGGPAFPDPIFPRSGMTLRDFFAAMALQGFLAQSHSGPKDWEHMGHGWGEDCANDLNKHSMVTAKTLANFAYRIADAMLEARKR